MKITVTDLISGKKLKIEASHFLISFPIKGSMLLLNKPPSKALREKMGDDDGWVKATKKNGGLPLYLRETPTQIAKLLASAKKSRGAA